MSNAYVITEFSLKCCYTVLMCIRPWLHWSQDWHNTANQHCLGKLQRRK
jgi:hypothetical protein